MPKDNWIPATAGAIPPSGWILVREANTGKDYWVDPKTLKKSAPRTRLTCEPTADRSPFSDS